MDIIYPVGSIAEANVTFDPSVPARLSDDDQAIHINHGKSTSYHLLLGLWNGKLSGDDVHVPYETYTCHPCRTS